MRYLIQFADRSSKRISEAEATAIKQALAAGKPIMLRDAYLAPHYVSAVKPITGAWFDSETVRDYKELPKPQEVLEDANARTLGIPDMKTLHETSTPPKLALLAKLK